MFLKPEKLQNHSNEGKGKEKKKERGEGKDQKKKKAMVALLVFIIATLERVFGRKNCSMQRAHLTITLSKIRLDLNLEQYFSILKLGFVINGDIH